MTLDECKRAKLVTEWLKEKPRDVTEPRLRSMIMHPESQKQGGDSRQKEGQMPATAQSDKLKQSDVAKLAKTRVEGGTWADIDDAAGFHLSSTGWRELFEEHGFDKGGDKLGAKVKKSKARAWGSAGNGKAPKAKKAKGKAKTTKKKKVVKRKATA